MTSFDEKNQDDDSSGDGSGGHSGRVEFHDFLSTSEGLRDDLLSGDAKRHLLATHKELHETRVKQQKELREARLEVKNGKIPLAHYRAALSGAGSGTSQFKPNPELADKAQFSGAVDNKVNSLTTEFEAETNQKEQDELRLRLGYQPELTPKFNPKPRYP